MALVPLASIVELERRIGETITDSKERDRALALLTDASTLVRHEAGRTWVDADGELTDVPDVAVAIALAAAMRSWYNPAGVESTQLGAVSVRFPDVWLTSRERDQLTSLTRQGIISVDTSHGYGWDCDTVGWAPVDYGGGAGVGTADWFPIGY